jgi:hypothetical protein
VALPLELGIFLPYHLASSTPRTHLGLGSNWRVTLCLLILGIGYDHKKGVHMSWGVIPGQGTSPLRTYMYMYVQSPCENVRAWTWESDISLAGFEFRCQRGTAILAKKGHFWQKCKKGHIFNWRYWKEICLGLENIRKQARHQGNWNGGGRGTTANAFDAVVNF